MTFNDSLVKIAMNKEVAYDDEMMIIHIPVPNLYKLSSSIVATSHLKKNHILGEVQRHSVRPSPHFGFPYLSIKIRNSEDYMKFKLMFDQDEYLTECYNASVMDWSDFQRKYGDYLHENE